ncbi:hypothetical protein [Oscillospiraceae bacterium]|nr:hypothetical protein [Oscillospiraceae bacterium]
MKYTSPIGDVHLFYQFSSFCQPILAPDSAKAPEIREF